MFADAIVGSSSLKDNFGINENNQNDPQFIDHFRYEHNTFTKTSMIGQYLPDHSKG